MPHAKQQSIQPKTHRRAKQHRCTASLQMVGKAVAVSVGTGTPLNMLTLEDFKEISPEYGEDVHEVFNLDRAFALRTNPGAPNPENTARRITYWQGVLS